MLSKILGWFRICVRVNIFEPEEYSITKAMECDISSFEDDDITSLEEDATNILIDILSVATWSHSSRGMPL